MQRWRRWAAFHLLPVRTGPRHGHLSSVQMKVIGFVVTALAPVPTLRVRVRVRVYTLAECRFAPERPQMEMVKKVNRVFSDN